MLQVVAVVEQISWGSILRMLKFGNGSWVRHPYGPGPIHTPVDELLVRYDPSKSSRADKLASFTSASTDSSEHPEFQAAIAERAESCVAAESHVDDNKWRCQYPFSLKSVTVKFNKSTPLHPAFRRALAELLALGVQLSDAINLNANLWLLAYPVSEIDLALQGITDAESLRASLGLEKVVSASGERRLSLEDCDLSRSVFDEDVGGSGSWRLSRLCRHHETSKNSH